MKYFRILNKGQWTCNVFADEIRFQGGQAYAYIGDNCVAGMGSPAVDVTIEMGDTQTTEVSPVTDDISLGAMAVQA